MYTYVGMYFNVLDLWHFEYSLVVKKKKKHLYYFVSYKLQVRVQLIIYTYII